MKTIYLLIVGIYIGITNRNADAYEWYGIGYK